MSQINREESKMADREVQTIRDLIYYQYSKLICRSSFKIPDGTSSEEEHNGFVKKTFQELKNGIKQWTDIVREDLQFVESDRNCIYCDESLNITQEHIVPKALKLLSKCGQCDRIQGAHNLVWICRECKSTKGFKGLYEFYKSKYPEEEKYYNYIPPLAEKKYLKTIFCCHECLGTLDRCEVKKDNKIDVLDIDYIFNRL